MQLSVSSGKNGIIQRATLLTFGDSTDHTTDYPLADMVSSANRWVQDAAKWIWGVSGTWEFDDFNQTDLPIATTTLVAGQQDYSLASTQMELLRVEVMDAGGNYNKLIQLDQTEIPVALSEFEKTNGMPVYYDILGNSLFLYPAPASGSVTLAAGLKIYFAREATTFSVPGSYTTADTTQPGFDEIFHDIIPFGIAYDYLVSNDMDRADKFLQKIYLLKKELESHYGRKNKDKRIKLNPRVQSYI